MIDFWGTIHISLYHGHYNFSRDDGAGSYTKCSTQPTGDSPARLQPPFARKETRGSHVGVIWGRKMRRKHEKTIDFRRIYVLLHSSWLYKATCKTVYGLSTSQSSSGYLSGNQPNICSQMWLAQIEYCSLRMTMRKLLSNGTIYLMYANCDITYTIIYHPPN